mgnify:CR=1 FL=1
MKIFKRRRMIGVAMVILSMCLVTSEVQAEILRISLGSDSSECDSDGCADTTQARPVANLKLQKEMRKKRVSSRNVKRFAFRESGSHGRVAASRDVRRPRR